MQDSSAGGVEGGAKVGSALEVSEDADELDKVALGGIRVVGGCHDDRDLNLAAHHEEMDEAADDSLILLLINRGGILGVLEEVHGIGRSLGGKRVRAAGRENLEDGMEHGCSEGAGDGVKVESDAEVAVHGGFVEDAGVAFVQLEDGLVPEAAASEDRGAVVNMGVEDHHEARVVLASPEELARISEVSGVTDGDEGSGVVEVEDAVGGLGSIDTAQEFDISVGVGSREVAGEAPIEWSWAILGSELALEESAWDIVATELDEGQVSVLDGIGDDGVDSEEEEMVISSGSVGGGIAGSAGGILFHGAEAGSHALEGVIREELELKEQEESVVDSVGGDVGLLDELECLVSNEHLFHLLGESGHDRVAIANHRESFLD
jgi:hypothetical protein